MKYLAIRGIPHARTNAGRKGGVHLAPEGWPDIVVCYKGRFVAIECKRPGGKMRKAQDIMLHELVMNGALVIVAESVRDVANSLDDAT